MARLWQSGFEMGSLTSLLDGWSNITATAAPSTTTVRSGVYSGRITNLVSATGQQYLYNVSATTTTGPLFFRAYFNYATLPSITNRILVWRDSGGSTRISIDINTDGTLTLRDEDGVIGSNSPALAANTWYAIELQYDGTGAGGAHIVNVRLNFKQFAGATNRNISTGIQSFRVGGNLQSEANTAGDWFFDDCAINDSTGTTQTSYPGEGRIIHLKPNAAGDANTFATQTGGTAGSGNNFTRVNELVPDDATTFNGSNTLNQEDTFNMENSGISLADSVTLVGVGARFRNSTADATTALKLEIKKTSAGTTSQSAAIVPNTTTWNTNGTVAPRNYQLIKYTDPDSGAWTQTTLDSMIVGYILSTGGTNRIDVTNVWASVEFVLTYLPSVSDSSAISDTPTLSPTSYINVSDSSAVGETVTEQLFSNINISDSSQIRESLTMGSVIVLDSSANFSSVLTSISGAYTTAGTNRALIAFVYSASGLFDIANPTYGGVTMNNADFVALPAGYSGFVAAYYLTNPAIGSNTFAVARTGTGTIFRAVIASYYNVEQDGSPDATSTATVLLSNSITATVAANFDNDWTILGVVSGLSGTITAGSGSTSRTSSSPLWLLDSNGSVGPIGNYSMTANSSAPTDGMAAIILSIDPYIFFSTQPYLVEGDNIFVFDAPTIYITTLFFSISDSTIVTDSIILAGQNSISVGDIITVNDTGTLLESVLSLGYSFAVIID